MTIDLDALIRRMSRRDKLDQLQVVWRRDLDEAKALARRGIGALFWPASAEDTNALQRAARDESPHGIPLLICLDVIHGHRTTFPIPLAEAASFDPAVAFEDAAVSSAEASSGGVNWTFSPMVDVARDPRWGRVAESFGEDPVLTARFGVAKVQGYQGDDLAAADSIVATAKHFVGYGAAEGGRDYNTVDMSEQRLRNVYLPPFRAAVHADAGSVMASFNTLSGVPMHGNRRLLREVLKQEWGFRGVVVGDAEGVVELARHGVAEDEDAAVRLALDAGVDVEMGGHVVGADGEPFPHADALDDAVLDDAVRRVLTLKARLGLFDDPFVDAEREAVTVTSERREAARRSAERCAVLLKNDGGLLPLQGTRRILLAGPYARSDDHLGAWVQFFALRSGTIEDAMRSEFPDAHLTVLDGASFDGDRPDLRREVAAAAPDHDVVVLALGEPSALSGEAASRSDIRLPGDQEALIHAVAETGVPFVVVLENGRPLDLSGWFDRAPAVLEAWHAGLEAPAAIAHLLSGRAAPAGRLPAAFPRSVGQIPQYDAHERTGRPATVGAQGGLTTGDWVLEGPNNVAEHFTSKYLDLDLGPLLPFGHGLSYTWFAIRDLALEQGSIELAAVDSGSTVRVSVAVANRGPRDGEDVIMLFVRDQVASIAPPVRRLAGFERVAVPVGQERTVVFEVGRDELGFWTNDPAGRWVIERGAFTLSVSDGTQVLQADLEVR
jgi:beta-glucosidase